MSDNCASGGREPRPGSSISRNESSMSTRDGSPWSWSTAAGDGVALALALERTTRPRVVRPGTVGVVVDASFRCCTLTSCGRRSSEWRPSGDLPVHHAPRRPRRAVLRVLAGEEISSGRRKRRTDLFHDVSFRSCSSVGSIASILRVDRRVFFPGTLVVRGTSRVLGALSEGLSSVRGSGGRGAGLSGARETRCRALADAG